MFLYILIVLSICGVLFFSIGGKKLQREYRKLIHKIIKRPFGGVQVQLLLTCIEICGTKVCNMYNFYIDQMGYPRWKDSHLLVHRTVARNKVGGIIFPDMIVHHIDGNKRNFRKKNLYIMSRSNHSKLHCLERKLNKKLILF